MSRDDASLSADPDAAASLSPGTRRGIGILLALHVLAVFVAPLASRPNPSEFAAGLQWLFQPYLDTAYLNHGYGFFSPDPGSSFIARYEVELKDGTTLPPRRIPDLRRHWPRLLYHRHFMLTSQARGLPGLFESYVRHLKHKYGARSVRLTFYEHRPSSPEEIGQGRGLDEEDTYRPAAVVTIDEEDRIDVQMLLEEGPPGVAPPRGVAPPGTMGPFPGPYSPEPVPFGPLRPPFSPGENGSTRDTPAAAEAVEVAP